MHSSAVTIYCSNSRCQAGNSANEQICYKCKTPLLKRYLWGLGDKLKSCQPGIIIDDRYHIVKSSLVLDTRPSQAPQLSQEITTEILPYLKLIPYRLNIPQIYGQVTIEIDDKPTNVWLLEYGSLRSDQETRFAKGKILPALSQVWQEADGLRQLNWLWQIAQLVQPLSQQQVASSLLKPSLLRISGSVFQLLELRPDNPDTNLEVIFRQLGTLWAQWVSSADETIQPWLEKLSTQLTQGEIKKPDILLAKLDAVLANYGKNQTRRYQITTRTDQGRTREHNEDACYPTTAVSLSSKSFDSLTIVCDGVGGHDGGEIASQLAIEAIQEGVAQLPLDSDNLDPNTILQALEIFTCNANDLISKRNDLEKRSDRQRMGTTLVMSLAHAHQMYVAHIGDSRAYWITRSGCYQVTLDDDLASRETRLGYTLYRNAIRSSGSGSLVQALGMSSSRSLRPGVQRFVLDEDSIFLLCSDGLSDFDRVEQYWETKILPILTENADLETVADELITLANTKNGHDNITISLVYAQVETDKDQRIPLASSLPIDSVNENEEEPVYPGMNTVEMPSTTSAKKSPPSLLSTILVGLLGLGIGLGLSFFFGSPERRERSFPWLQSNPDSPADILPLPEGTQVQLQESLTLAQGNPGQQQIIGQIPPASIIEIMEKDDSSAENILLKVRICSLPLADENEPPTIPLETNTEPLRIGGEGWVEMNSPGISEASILTPEEKLTACPLAATSTD